MSMEASRTRTHSKLGVVFFIGLILRIVSFFTLSHVLPERPELVTPVSSMNRVLEGRWLGQVLGDFYFADGYHGPPTLLWLVNSILDAVPHGLVEENVVTFAFCVFCDLLVTVALFGLVTSSRCKDELADGDLEDIDEIGVHARKGGNLEFLDYRNSFGVENAKLDPVIPAAVYFLNPVIVLTCVAQSSAALHYFFCVFALWCVSGRNRVQNESSGLQLRWLLLSATSVAIAGLFELFWLTLAIPCALLWSRYRTEHGAARKFKCITLFGSLVAMIWGLLVWYTVVHCGDGSLRVFNATFLWTYNLGDLSPNIGIWWYFWAEVFGRFRDYFLFVFNIHPYLYVIPLLIQFHSRPLLFSHVLMGIYFLFQAYPQLSGMCLVLALACMHPKTVGRMKFLFVNSIILGVPLSLLPVMWYMWLKAESGNANFFYFQTLAVVMFSSFFLLEFTSATIRRDRLAKKWSRKDKGLVQGAKRA